MFLRKVLSIILTISFVSTNITYAGPIYNRDTLRPASVAVSRDGADDIKTSLQPADTATGPLRQPKRFQSQLPAATRLSDKSSSAGDSLTPREALELSQLEAYRDRLMANWPTDEQAAAAIGQINSILFVGITEKKTIREIKDSFKLDRSTRKQRQVESQQTRIEKAIQDLQAKGDLKQGVTVNFAKDTKEAFQLFAKGRPDVVIFLLNSDTAEDFARTVNISRSLEDRIPIVIRDTCRANKAGFRLQEILNELAREQLIAAGFRSFYPYTDEELWAYLIYAAHYMHIQKSVSQPVKAVGQPVKPVARSAKSSSAGGSLTPQQILAKEKLGFPVKMAKAKAKGIDISRPAGKETILTSATLFFDPTEKKAKFRGVERINPSDLSANIALDFYMQSVTALWQVEQRACEARGQTFTAAWHNSPVYASLEEFFKGTSTIPIQVIKDNDKLVDIIPKNREAEEEKITAIRVDKDLFSLGMSLVNGQFETANPRICQGALLLCQLSFIYSMACLKGLDEREALHYVVDFYLSLPEQKDRDAIIEVLRTEKIDSGNIFNIFLRAIADVELVEEVEGVDIRSCIAIPSVELKAKAAEIETRQAKLSEADRKELDTIERALRWRDKQISWLLLYQRIDIPFDYERTDAIMKEAQAKRNAGEQVNVDEHQVRLHEAVTATFDPEIEDGNIMAIAKWANQNKIRLVSGRLGRAFENQARMTSVAKYIAVTEGLRAAAIELRDSVSDIEVLKNPAQRLVLLLSQQAEPSEVEVSVSVKNLEDAVIDYRANETKKIQGEKRAYQMRLAKSEAGLKAFDVRLEELAARSNSLLRKIESLRKDLDAATKRDAAFVFMIQRFIPAETHKYARAVTFRDVDPGKEQDIRDLLRQGGHMAYCTPGQGKELNALMFCDDIIEAIPMLVKERVIRIQRPDGTHFDVTQAEVDQKGMEAFFRNVFAPYFLKNIKHAIATQHIELAREILFKTAKYKGVVERHKNLPFAQFMEAIRKEIPEFPKEVAFIAASIDTAYWECIDIITAYREKTGCDRLAAVREQILGKETRIQADTNCMDLLLRKIERGEDVAKAIEESDTIHRMTRGIDWTDRFDKTIADIAAYWDWRPRRTPTLHDLTTQAPGLTEGYIRQWIEEEMALIGLLEYFPKHADEASKRRREYTERVIACTEKVLKEYGMEAVVEEVWAATGARNREEALMNVLTSYPFVSDEVSRLAVLIEFAESKARPKNPKNTADVDEVERYLTAHKDDADFIDMVIKGTVVLNGLEIQNQISAYQRQNSCDYRTAALAVIMRDEGFKQDYENQGIFYARGKVLDELDKAHPAAMLKSRTKSYIRDHTALVVSTARKEVVAKQTLQGVMIGPRYNISADGPRKAYNLIYTPSRVNIGENELRSVRFWGQAIGAVGFEAEAAGYDFYRLINSHPIVYLSPKIAEALKAAENGSMQSQLAFGNSVALLINFLGVGDAQRLLHEMMSRGERIIPYPGEGYGGYCVPKDGLFLSFVVALTQEQKLSDMGVDVRFHQDVIALAERLLKERAKFSSEFEWENWAANEMSRAVIGDGAVNATLGQYIDVTDKGDPENKVLIFNITNLAKIIEGVGRPLASVSSAEHMFSNLLAEWSLDSTIVQAERINRMMPFVKAWMILRNHSKRVNLTAEYKSIKGADRNVGDVRFATGIRIFEILTGCCDHLIRQLDEQGQHMARLLRFGFDPESKDEDVKKASLWFMEKNNISPADKELIERLKKETSYEIPEDIILTVASGVAVKDILDYTTDRQVSMNAIATEVQKALEAKGLSDRLIAAAVDSYGADITKWPKIKDDPDLPNLLASEIEIRGLDGQVYKYPFKGALHYLALKQRTLPRNYERGIQGCDALNLGVVSGELDTLVRDAPKLVTLMLTGQPLAEPKLFDGQPGRSGNAPRTYTDPDVKMFFAACENSGLSEGEFATNQRYGKSGIYEAIGLGSDEIKMLRENMHQQRERAHRLLKALETLTTYDSLESAEAIAAVDSTKSLLASIEYDVNVHNEARKALDDEKMFKDWGRSQPRDEWIARCLSNLAAGLPLAELEFGTWLAMGGMYLLAGKSQREIDAVRAKIEKGVGIINASSVKSASAGSIGLSEAQSQQCVKALLMSEYRPELAAFGQEKLVAISSKAIEASATLARDRRRALAKRAAVARAERITRTKYKEQLYAEEAGKDSLEAQAALIRDGLAAIMNLTERITSGQNSQADLDSLNEAYGRISASTKRLFGLLVDKFAGRFDSANATRDIEIRSQLKRDIDEVFGVNGFNNKAIGKFLGGYESIGDLALLANAAKKSEADLNIVTTAIELFYNLYAIAQTIPYLQVPREDVDARMFWDSVTVFFAETINDHFYEYLPWTYTRANAYKPLLKAELYNMAADHHRWLYRYLRMLIVKLTDISKLSEKDRCLLLGDYTDTKAIDGIGVDYERKPDGSVLNEGEPFWRAYNQLREITFIMNDGLAATDIMKQNPDLRKKGFEANATFPMPFVFENFDPAIIDAQNRVNMALLFPVGRTHQSKLLRAGASCNLSRLAKGKTGLNVIISRFASIKEVNGKNVVVIKDGQFYMSSQEFKNALRVCKGYSETVANAIIARFEKLGMIVDGRIRVAARFSTPIIATSVVPFHHLPIFDNGELEAAGIPATCQSLYTEDVTYDKALYEEMLEGTGVNMPKEIRWLAEWTDVFGDDKYAADAIINGFDFDRDSAGQATGRFKGLRAAADELATHGEKPIIIVKGAAESGARNMKVLLLADQKGMTKEEALKEAANFILMVSRTPQHVVIQNAIRINPELWASEAMMDEFIERRVTERSSAVVRTRYPRTPYYCSFRLVPSSSSPERPYDMTSHIVVTNTEIATNVGRGGTLEPLLAEWIQAQYRDTLVRVLDKAAARVMQANNNFAARYAERFRKKFGRDIGTDALGTPYSWAPTLLLDFLVEPVFEREGRIVDIAPRYDAKGKRIGSDVILEDEKGERFVGKIKDGEEGLRIYLIEPNTGIGQIDRRTLRMEELEVKKAAKANKPVNWQAIECDDHTILNNWADRGFEYGRALFGDDFFKPSPLLAASARVSVVSAELHGLERLAQQAPVTQSKPAGIKYDETLERAIPIARQALGLGPDEVFDSSSFSVLLKYYLIELLKKEDYFASKSVEDIRKDFLTGKLSKEGLDKILGNSDAKKRADQKFLMGVFSPFCPQGLHITPRVLEQDLTESYISEVWGLVRSHFMTAWSGKEVEIYPSSIPPSRLMELMPGKSHILAHLSYNNPVAPNETYALMADADLAEETRVAVVGVDVADITAGNGVNKVLALVQFPDKNNKRLVRFNLVDPLKIDAVWRDETCPVDIEAGSMLCINPKSACLKARDKGECYLSFTTEGVAVPKAIVIGQGLKPSEIRSIMTEFIGDSNTGIFISPNKGTQGIGTEYVKVTKANLEEKIDGIIGAVTAILQQDNDNKVIVREEVRAARYQDADGKDFALDFRFNVIYEGGDNYAVESEYAAVAPTPEEAVVSVNRGARIISLFEAHKQVITVLADGRKPKINLTDETLENMRKEACLALKAINKDLPEGKRLLFAGVDVKLQVSLDFLPPDYDVLVGKPVVFEVNAQAAGLSHSYKPFNLSDTEAVPQVSTSLWNYIAVSIKPKSSSAGADKLQETSDELPMKATIEAMKSITYLSDLSHHIWDITDIEKQKRFFELIISTAGDRHLNSYIRGAIVFNYIHWLLDAAFPKMQQRALPEFKNRLYPNELMEFITARLSEPKNSDAMELFKDRVKRDLAQILLKIAERNLDVYYRFFADMAGPDALTAALNVARRQPDDRIILVNPLDKYIRQQRQKPAAEMVKAEIACAIMADIRRHYDGLEYGAQQYEAMIKEIDRAIYEEYKTKFLGQRQFKPQQLVEGGETQVFFGLAPNRICWSSAVGSDARYNVLLDPDGGWAINAPVLFSEEAARLAMAMPVTASRRLGENKIVLQAVSNMVTGRPTTVTLTADNIGELYCARDGKVFTDIKDVKDTSGRVTQEADPLNFLKFALFFTGIVGSGIDSVPDSVISAEQKTEAKKNPLALAQLYYDRCPKQALADINAFTRGGGIEIICDNHSSPVSAGFSSSSSASISILLALYAMSGQREFVDDVSKSFEMALIFENLLGRGTGPQDTTGIGVGIKDISYKAEAGSVRETVAPLDIPKDIIGKINSSTIVFMPGSPRAASVSIGARQIAYLLKEPARFKAIQIAKQQHQQIREALLSGDFQQLGRLMWEYTLNRNRIHDALPHEMEKLFRRLLGEGETGTDRKPLIQGVIPLIYGGELAGAMGRGASAILVATDYGLEQVQDPQTTRPISRLDLELKRVIAEEPIFKNGAIRYIKISQTGPHVESENIDPMKTSAADIKELMNRVAAETKASSAGRSSGLEGRIKIDIVSTIDWEMISGHIMSIMQEAFNQIGQAPPPEEAIRATFKQLSFFGESRAKSIVLVAHDGVIPVGFICGGPLENYPLIGRLVGDDNSGGQNTLFEELFAVEPTYQQRGVGQMLWDSFKSIAGERGYKFISALTREAEAVSGQIVGAEVLKAGLTVPGSKESHEYWRLALTSPLEATGAAISKASSSGTLLNLDDLTSLTPQALQEAMDAISQWHHKTPDDDDEFLQIFDAPLYMVYAQSRFASRFAKLAISGTIVFDDDKLSDQQKGVITSILGKNTQSLQKLEELMSCTIRLKSQLSQEDIKGELIIISEAKLDEYPNAKYLLYQQPARIDNAYIPAVAMIAMAKGLLSLKDKEQTKLIDDIKELSHSLCSKPLQDEIIKQYLEAGVFKITLPIPTPYDYERLQLLHQQAMAALIAA